MKKKVWSIVALAIVVTSVTAQDTTKASLESTPKAVKQEPSVPEIKSKKGENYLPEAGDWAIGFDAIPLINTVGKIVSANPGATTVTGTGGSTNYISLKKFTDAQTAYRGVLGINFGTTTSKMYVADVTSTTTPPAQKTDEQKISTSSFVVGGGLEKRRGNTRLQGYYGGLLMVTIGTSGSEYTYGNSLTTANTTHTNSFGQGTGVKSTKAGTTFGINLNGLVGAEYFVLPKVSIGAEYWWGVGYTSTGDGEVVTESWDATNVKSLSTKTKTAGGNTFTIGGKYGATALAFVNLHF